MVRLSFSICASLADTLLAGGVVMSTVILTCLTTINYIYGVIRASEYIHRRLVASILGTTMRCVLSV